MEEYLIKIEEYKKSLSLLSNQIIEDLRGILLDQIIKYELKKSNLDISFYLFEYGHELYDLYFYGYDAEFNCQTEVISLPTKFPNKDYNCLTSKQINKFEKEKFINSCTGKMSEKEKEYFEKFLKERKRIFEEWFLNCWLNAKKNINNTKGAYFSIHDTDERIDLTSMKTITDNEIINKLNKNTAPNKV